MDLKLSFDVVWTVLGLVGEHHMPKRLVVKNQNKNEYLALSRRANLELLYWLEVADMKGRDCPDKSLQLQHLDEFKMFARDYGVWNTAHRLDNEFLQSIENESNPAREYIYSTALYEVEAGLVSLPVESIARTFERKNSYSNLVVLCGPSGSGKSTWLGRHVENSTLISLDEIREELGGSRANQKNNGRVVHLAKDRLEECLRNNQNVVWDATNLRSDFRKVLCDFGRDYKALVTLVLFLPSESAIFQRNRKRLHPVPNDVLLKQLDGFQFPLVGEAYRMQVIDERGNCCFSTGYEHFDTEKIDSF
jgi:predicted kinase